MVVPIAVERGPGNARTSPVFVVSSPTFTEQVGESLDLFGPVLIDQGFHRPREFRGIFPGCRRWRWGYILRAH